MHLRLGCNLSFSLNTIDTVCLIEKKYDYKNFTIMHLVKFLYTVLETTEKKTDLRKQTSNQHFRKKLNIFYISINASINLHSFLFSTYTKAISSITSCTKLYCRASSSVLWRSFGSGFSERKSKESLISKTAEINIVYQGLISFICY